MSDIQKMLYDNWLRRLAALKAEAVLHDWSREGQARYDRAYLEAKQAYDLLWDEELKLYNAGNQQVFSSGGENARREPTFPGAFLPDAE